MKRVLLLAAVLAGVLLAQARIPYPLVSSKRPASGQTPDTVVSLGRLEDSTAGTTVTLTIAGNGFIGEPAGTWTIGGAGSTYPTVQTTQQIFEDGVQISGGAGLGDSGNTRMWFFRHSGNDRYPQFTPTVEPTVVVFGFSMMCSNWNESTSGSFNILRIGQSDFVIVNFGDGSEGDNTFQSIQMHTGAGGLGSFIAVTNEIWYRVVGYYDQSGTVELSVYAIAGPGSYSLIGTSSLAMDPGGADYIRFTNEDDHGETTGDDIYTDNYMWSNTKADYPNGMLPNY